MKIALLTLILSFCTCLFVCAQTTSPPATGIIKGLVIDSASTNPATYATVTLMDVRTGKPVKSTYTNKSGRFTFTGVTIKPYKLGVILMGYRSKTLSLSPKTMTDLGTLLLVPATTQLTEISVTGVKPLTRQEVDRISYDVQADPENKVINVLDMLRRVPFISVDAADNIKLQGSTNYKILMNGKASALVARNPADIFRAMPASNIQKIEVITTPPAEYDAEGLAGIINIITKNKSDQQGLNGNINANYSSMNGPGSNLNLTLKHGKFGVSGYVGYNKQNRLGSTFHNVTDNYGLAYLNQDGFRTSFGNNAYGNADLSYEADSLNLITGTFELYKTNSNSENGQLSSLYQADKTTLNEFYRSSNNSKSEYSGLGLGLNYQLGFKRRRDQLLTLSYRYNATKTIQFFGVNFLERIRYTLPDYQLYNNSGAKENTLQLDYVHPVSKLNINAGAKAILRDNYSNFQNDTLLTSANSQYNTSFILNFNYRQNVYNAYNSYQLKFAKWVLKGGVRYEYTTVDGAYHTRQRYANVIPSVAIQRLYTNSSISLGYTDRIQRPGILQLNPFINSQNPNFIIVGNPDLHAVVSHNIELEYSNFKTGSINFSLSYRFANNTIEFVTNSGATRAISISTYQNVGKSNRLSLSLNTNYPLAKDLNVSVNAQLQQVWLQGVYNNRLYDNRGIQGYIFSDASYKLAKSYHLGVSINYDGRYILLQGKDNYYFGTSASVSKDIFNRKGSLGLSVSNPFNKYTIVDIYNRTADFYQNTSFRNNYRRVNISFNYKFGKLKGGIKKSRRGITNDDINGGRN